jgi:hypothetical protein
VRVRTECLPMGDKSVTDDRARDMVSTVRRRSGKSGVVWDWRVVIVLTIRVEMFLLQLLYSTTAVRPFRTVRRL